MKQEKQTLRQHICALRRQLSRNEQDDHSVQILPFIINHFLFIQAKHIAFYIASEGELDPQNLLSIAIHRNKYCYLPRIDFITNQLHFILYQPGDPLEKNKYGILEPVKDNLKFCAPDKLHLVFTPLVAFDNQGYRLGLGKGYYDKTFAFLNKQHTRTTKLIGLAHEFQRMDTFVADPWDVRLDGVLTEKFLRLF